LAALLFETAAIIARRRQPETEFEETLEQDVNG
jgi:hypothetical protein